MDILELIDDREQTVAECQERPFQCPEPDCSKSFNRKSDLQRHHRIHTNERPYCCNWRDCGKSFIQRSALTVHIRTHTGEKPHRCEAQGCGKCFSDSSSLARHRRIHTGKRPYLCPIDGCEKSFCRKTTLTKHARRTHQLREAEGSEGDETEDDVPKRSTPSKAQPMKHVAPTSGALVPPGKHAMPFSAAILRPNSQFHEPLTPQSSRNSSFSAASDPFNHQIMSQHSMHQPPTPRSPYYDEPEHQRPISPASIVRTNEYSPTSHSAAFENSLRISCPPPVAHQLIAQSMQNSPGSLSTCSSATSASCPSDYFFRGSQNHQQYSLPLSPHPISPGAAPAYPAQLPQHAQNQIGTVHYSQAPQNASVIQQIPVPTHESSPSWFMPDYAQPMMHMQTQNSYFPPSDMPYVKQEQEQSILPSPRGSFC